MSKDFASKLFVGLGLIGALLLGVTVFRFAEKSKLKAETARDEDLIVRTIVAKPAVNASVLTLPGNIQAFKEVIIYARTNGYLKSRTADIGDVVAKGQTLAQIESPEIDQELNQAVANLNQAQAAAKQAQANRNLAQTTLKRSSALKAEQLISQQNLDEKQSAYNARQADYEAAEASINAQRANVRRLKSLQAFQRVQAPFAGRITKRNTSIDVGALIENGQTELFRMAQTDTLRIFVNVPQVSASALKQGQAVEVTVPEMPDKLFKGKVTRTSMSLDPQTRTLLAEVQVANAGNLLLPGMYGQVKIPLTQAQTLIEIPSNALMVGTEGVKVAVLDEEDKISLRKVQLGRDYGQKVEILNGVSQGERIIINPTDEIREGLKVDKVISGERKP